MSQVAHYVFVGSNVFLEERTIPSPKAIEERLKRKYWALGERTPHRRDLKAGDQILFYAAGRGHSLFVATAVLATGCNYMSLQSRQELEAEFDFVLGASYGVMLSSAALFEKPVRAIEVLRQLSFVGTSKKWGLYFRGAVIKISQKDFDLVLSKTRTQNEKPETESS